MDAAARLADLRVDPEVSKAETLPGWVYTDPAVFARVRDQVLARGWHLVGDVHDLKAPGQVQPFTLLEGALDEALLLARGDDDVVRCLSNVCTHRAFPVVAGPGRVRGLTCGYHGRRFGLDGRFKAMPEFAGCEGFPCERDDLTQVPLGQWARFLFASLDPAAPFDALTAPLRERIGDWVGWDAMSVDPAAARSYRVHCNWALYLDNYLEGLHIPYVHPALNRALDWKAYRTELLPCGGSLQVGIGAPGEPCFDLPDGHPDAGQQVAAYYFFLFPGTLLNLYPWGLSINLIEPLAVDLTRVRYLQYVRDPSLRERGAGAGLDQVEREDQAVVEAQHRVLKGRLYTRGRYSPSQERGVHHFHRHLIAALRG